MGMPHRDFHDQILPTCSGLFRFFGGLAMQIGGGYKMSGYGREQGAEALESYTQYKSVWANLG